MRLFCESLALDLTYFRQYYVYPISFFRDGKGEVNESGRM